MLQQIMDITTLQDVETFLEQIANEIDGFHPMRNFSSYQRVDSTTWLYTEQEAEIRNKLLDKCFDVCTTVTPDCYTYLINLFRLIQAEMGRENKEMQEIASLQ